MLAAYLSFAIHLGAKKNGSYTKRRLETDASHYLRIVKPAEVNSTHAYDDAFGTPSHHLSVV